MTKSLIIQSHAGDSSSTLKLIEKFDPLLKKYSYKLNYEDAYNDLLFDFLKFLNTIPLDSIRNPDEGILINYIYKSIHNSYIKRLIALKKLHNVVPYSSLGNEQLYYIESSLAISDKYYMLELTGIESVLTELELSIVKMIYLLDYSVRETALIYGISRQAVNQTKKRAFQKLKKWFSTSIQ